jgi:uncharacterized protein YndB with AHSA1/START domain
MTNAVKTFSASTRDGMPYHKAKHEVESYHSVVTVKDYDGSNPATPKGWVEIFITETYTLLNGKRPVTKEINFTLDENQRSELLKMLQDRTF